MMLCKVPQKATALQRPLFGSAIVLCFFFRHGTAAWAWVTPTAFVVREKPFRGLPNRGAISTHSTAAARPRSENKLAATWASQNDPLSSDKITTSFCDEIYQDETLSSSSIIVPSPIQKGDEIAAAPKSWQDDGFVFGLPGSGLQRPSGRTAQLVVEGDSLQTKPFQVLLVVITLIGHATLLVHAGAGMMSAMTGWLATLSGDTAGLACVLMLGSVLGLTVTSWFLADAASGILHWSVDNYGNGRTPIMGSIIAAFQGHHTAPWTITERSFFNNVYKLCLPLGPWTILLLNQIWGPWDPMTRYFWTSFCVFEVLSQEFHKWAHALPSECPTWANTLQRWGLSVRRPDHAAHHLEPFHGNYCIISGICNAPLDQSGFFRRLEHVIFGLGGVEANSWKLDPLLKARTLAGDYSWRERH